LVQKAISIQNQIYGWFFKGFETIRTNGSLILIFLANCLNGQFASSQKFLSNGKNFFELAG